MGFVCVEPNCVCRAGQFVHRIDMGVLLAHARRLEAIVRALNSVLHRAVANGAGYSMDCWCAHLGDGYETPCLRCAADAAVEARDLAKGWVEEQQPA